MRGLNLRTLTYCSKWSPGSASLQMLGISATELRACFVEQTLLWIGKKVSSVMCRGYWALRHTYWGHSKWK